MGGVCIDAFVIGGCARRRRANVADAAVRTFFAIQYAGFAYLSGVCIDAFVVAVCARARGARIAGAAVGAFAFFKKAGVRIAYQKRRFVFACIVGNGAFLRFPANAVGAAGGAFFAV